jgi:twitching motility protein PilT
MRDGDTDGMQHFDGELEKLLRAGAIDLDTALGYSTNPGNLRLELADLVDADVHAKTDSAPAEVQVDR